MQTFNLIMAVLLAVALMIEAVKWAFFPASITKKPWGRAFYVLVLTLYAIQNVMRHVY